MLAQLVLPLVLGEGLAVPPPAPEPIVNGTVATTCQYPATVRISSCTATLVHPEVILYAAHCPNTNTVRFGVTGDDRTVSTSYCKGAPEYPALGFDYKYCKLSQPVTDVPIAPILMGCERDQLTVGTPIVVVGNGQTDGGGGGFGTKRWVDGTIAGFPDGGKKIGIFYDLDKGACFGDSGGSAYVKLADGSWRVFGITSTIAGSCGGSSQHIPMYNAVAWVEQDSGIDITPCHDADGAWNPGPDCTGAPEAIDDGAGLSWNNGCSGGPVGPDIETCGPPVGQPQDTTAPVIEIVDPAAGMYPGPNFSTPVEVTASDDWGLLDVKISFAGEEQGVFTEEPFKLATVGFPEGTWEITAVARDWSGNEAMALPVTIQVGMGGTGGTGGGTGGGSSGGATDSGSGSGGTSGEGSTGGGSTTGDPGTTTGMGTTGSDDGTGSSGGDGGDSSDGGCNCSTGAPGPGPGSLLLLGLLGLGRRRA